MEVNNLVSNKTETSATSPLTVFIFGLLVLQLIVSIGSIGLLFSLTARIDTLSGKEDVTVAPAQYRAPPESTSTLHHVNESGAEQSTCQMQYPFKAWVDGVCYEAQMLSQNSGESLCRGKLTDISWSVPARMEAVTISLIQEGQGVTPYLIGDYKADENGSIEGEVAKGHVSWVVGQTRTGEHVGRTFRLQVRGSILAHERALNYYLIDNSDKIFAIEECDLEKI
jgi:hypothetical protein